MTDSKISDLSYEEAREGLDAIVSAMERGTLAFEQVLTSWERGEALIAHCRTYLKRARARIDAAVAAAQEEQPEAEGQEDDSVFWPGPGSSRDCAIPRGYAHPVRGVHAVGRGQRHWSESSSVFLERPRRNANAARITMTTTTPAANHQPDWLLLAGTAGAVVAGVAVGRAEGVVAVAVAEASDTDIAHSTFG